MQQNVLRVLGRILLTEVGLGPRFIFVIKNMFSSAANDWACIGNRRICDQTYRLGLPKYGPTEQTRVA